MKSFIKWSKWIVLLTPAFLLGLWITWLIFANIKGDSNPLHWTAVEFTITLIIGIILGGRFMDVVFYLYNED